MTQKITINLPEFQWVKFTVLANRLNLSRGRLLEQLLDAVYFPDEKELKDKFIAAMFEGETVQEFVRRVNL